MSKPTMGSLFAGIGGFDLGFERAGFETAWQVEINDFCRKVLAKNFPHAKRFGDIRECGKHNLRPVDVMCGGFPCQDISNAGLRAGIEGERSGLWGEYARIIGELRPRFVLVENVAALLGRGMGRVLGDLSTLGYDAEWEVVSAADVGAPHLRERVWILAYPMQRGGRAEPGQQQGEWAALPDSSGAGDVAYTEGERRREARELRSDQPEERPAGCGQADAAYSHGQQHQSGASANEWQAGKELPAYSDSQHAQGQFASSVDTEGWPGQEQRSPGPCHAGGAGQWAVEPNVGRVAHGVPARVDRLRGLGNAVMPQIPEMYARKIKALLEAR